MEWWIANGVEVVALERSKLLCWFVFALVNVQGKVSQPSIQDHENLAVHSSWA